MSSAHQRALAVLTPREVRVLAAWLFDRASVARIARSEGMEPGDVRDEVGCARLKLAVAGFPVRRQRKRTVSFVDPDQLDRRSAEEA